MTRLSVVIMFILLLIATPTFGQPTGTIAFVTSSDGNLEIYRINADGSGLINLTNHPERDTSPDWSPDGQRIVFLSRRETPDTYQIFVMNADGSAVHRLSSEDAVTHRRPVWSPDGSQIAYEREENEVSAIYIMNADGSDPRLLIDPEQAPDAGGPAWSPDGTHIAFSAQGERSNDIFVLNLSNGQITQLTTAERTDIRPVWSPDGMLIAFSSRREGGESKVFLMNADGSNQRRLTGSPADRQESVTDWSPDGRTIMLSFEDGDLDNLHTIDLETGQITPFRVSLDYDNDQAVWKPEPNLSIALPAIAEAPIIPTNVPDNLLTLGGVSKKGISATNTVVTFLLDTLADTLITVQVDSPNPEAYFSSDIIGNGGSFLLPLASVRVDGTVQDLYMLGADSPYELRLFGEGEYEVTLLHGEAISEQVTSLFAGASAAGTSDRIVVYQLDGMFEGDTLAIETSANFISSLVDSTGAQLYEVSADFDYNSDSLVTRYVLQGPAPYFLALTPGGEFAVSLNVSSAATMNTTVRPGETVVGASVGSPLLTYNLEGVNQGDLVTLRLDGEALNLENVELYTLLMSKDGGSAPFASDALTSVLERKNHLVAVYRLAEPGPYQILLPGLNTPYTMTVISGDGLTQSSLRIPLGIRIKANAAEGAVIPLFPIDVPATADQITVQLDDLSRLMQDSIEPLKSSHVFLQDADGRFHSPVFSQLDETRRIDLFELAGTRPPYSVIVRDIEGSFDLTIQEGDRLTQAVLRAGETIVNQVPPPSSRHIYRVELEQPATLGLLLQPGSGVNNGLSVQDTFELYPSGSSTGGLSGETAIGGRGVRFYSLNAGTYLVQVNNNPRGSREGTYSLTLVDKDLYDQGLAQSGLTIDLLTTPNQPVLDPVDVLTIEQVVSGTLDKPGDRPGLNTRDGFEITGFSEGQHVDFFIESSDGLPNLYSVSSDYQSGQLYRVTQTQEGTIYSLSLVGRPPYQIVLEGITQYVLRMDGLSKITDSLDLPSVSSNLPDLKSPIFADAQGLQVGSSVTITDRTRFVFDAPPESMVTVVMNNPSLLPEQLQIWQMWDWDQNEIMQSPNHRIRTDNYAVQVFELSGLGPFTLSGLNFSSGSYDLSILPGNRLSDFVPSLRSGEAIRMMKTDSGEFRMMLVNSESGETVSLRLFALRSGNPFESATVTNTDGVEWSLVTDPNCLCASFVTQGTGPYWIRYRLPDEHLFWVLPDD